MEGGVPRVEKPDSERKNFHLSKQAGRRERERESKKERVSHGNSESNSERAPHQRTQGG